MEETCTILTYPNYVDSLEAYANWAKMFLPGGSCLNTEYSNFVRIFRNESLLANPMRRWIWQTCSEFGWYQTSASQNQPFGTSCPVERYFSMCRDLFDESYVNDHVIRF